VSGGWTIRLKNWHAPLYVRAEMPPKHVAWTGNRDDAMRFPHRKDALAFLERLNELPDQCDIRFHRGAPQ